MALLLHDLKIQRVSYSSPWPFLEKKGLLLSWLDDKGKRYFSDVCPLDGYSKETIFDVEHQIKQLLENQILEEDLYPSLHFALMHPLSQLECLKPQSYQALVHKKTLDQDLKRLHKFSCVKIKITDFEPKELTFLINTLSKTHKIRLDAQRKPIDPKVLTYLLDHEDFYEYVEEPSLVQNLAKLLKIALDETLYLEKTIPEGLNPVALVYKPTLVGGIKRLQKIAKNIPVVLSSCYETSLGILRIMKLSQSHFLGPHDPIGLDTCPLHDGIDLIDKNPPYIDPKNSYNLQDILKDLVTC